MKKPDKPKDGPKAWAAPIDDILIPLPYLAEFLAATHYEGQPPGSRVTGSLLVFAQDDYWKVRIQDKEEGRCSWLTISSLLELLEASNDRLGAADPGWKPDRAAPRQEGKDKKGQK
jgi:hypothetical protein